MGCWEPQTLGWTGVSDWSQYLQLLEAQPSQLQRLAPRAQSAPLLSTPLFRLPLQLLLCYLQHQGLRIRRRDRSPPGWMGERGEDRARRPPQPRARANPRPSPRFSRDPPSQQPLFLPYRGSRGGPPRPKTHHSKPCPPRTIRSPALSFKLRPSEHLGAFSRRVHTFSCSFLEAEILDFFCRGEMERGKIRVDRKVGGGRGFRTRPLKSGPDLGRPSTRAPGLPSTIWTYYPLSNCSSHRQRNSAHRHL